MIGGGGYIKALGGVATTIAGLNTLSRLTTAYNAKVVVDCKKELFTSYAQRYFNANDLEFTTSGLKGKTIEAARNLGEATLLEQSDFGIISNIVVRPFVFRVYKKVYGIDPLYEAGNVSAAKAEVLLNSEVVTTGVELVGMLVGSECLPLIDNYGFFLPKTLKYIKV